VKTGMVGGVGIPGAVDERDTDVVDGDKGDEVVLGIAVQFGRVKVPLKEPEAPYTMQFLEQAASPLTLLLSQHGL
jgi:hypothetical protein